MSSDPLTVLCGFRTQTPLNALAQSARGGDVRYGLCKNRATHTVVIVESSLRWERERGVPCCSLHKRMHEERGWLP